MQKICGCDEYFVNSNKIRVACGTLQSNSIVEWKEREKKEIYVMKSPLRAHSSSH